MCLVIPSLCAWSYRAYVLGHVGRYVGLCMYICMCVCVYVYVDKKRAVWGLTTRKFSISVIYCSLVEFNGQNGGLLCQAIHSEKEIWSHSINGTEKDPGKLYYGKPHLVYTCTAIMQC